MRKCNIPLLLVCKLNTSSAAITLHNPFIDFDNPQSISTARCVNAARRILESYYSLSATSLDITRLHPFIVACPLFVNLSSINLISIIRFAGI